MLDRRPWDAGIFVAHLATELDDRIEDSTGRINRGQHLLFVNREGEDLPAFLRVPPLDGGPAVFGPPDGKPSFLPQIDEAVVDI